jgi:hypothetical protein
MTDFVMRICLYSEYRKRVAEYDMEESEYFTVATGGQDSALDFIENSVWQEVLEGLEIENVEGDRACGNYFAEKLHIPIEQANETAFTAGNSVLIVSSWGIFFRVENLETIFLTS